MIPEIKLQKIEMVIQNRKAEIKVLQEITDSMHLATSNDIPASIYNNILESFKDLIDRELSTFLKLDLLVKAK